MKGCDIRAAIWIFLIAVLTGFLLVWLALFIGKSTSGSPLTEPEAPPCVADDGPRPSAFGLTG